MHPWLSRGLAALALIIACAVPPAVAETTSYPDRPVHLVVGFPPGGPVDVVARALGQELEKLLGQPVVIENRAGAGGIIGTEAVARAAPDGYTLLLATTTLTIQETLYKNLTYSALRDFTPVAAIAAGPQVLIVNKDVPAKNVQELIALAKSEPGKLNYGSYGVGTYAHLSMEDFKQRTGTDIVHIPYRGAAPAAQALLAGDVNMLLLNYSSIADHEKDGKVRILAAAGDKRTPVRPELPTIAEAGVQGYEMGYWFAAYAPAKTPPAVVKRLNELLVKAAKSEAAKTAFYDPSGTEVFTSTPEELAKFQQGESQKWGRIVKAAGIEAE